jgi:hypothetical protein
MKKLSLTGNLNFNALRVDVNVVVATNILDSDYTLTGVIPDLSTL